MDKINNVISASYIGKPISNTVMYISKKIEKQLFNLRNVTGCLIFCENSIEVPKELLETNTFIMTSNPQLEYSRYVNSIASRIETENRSRKYTLTKDGYYVGENVKIGKNAYIEPLCLIDHDVIIGDNAHIFTGSKIRRAIIGDNFVAFENSVVGSYGFTMATDESGAKVRIPTLGKVIIGNNVEAGMLCNIAVGSGGNTIIDDNVKIDAFVHIAHDVHLEHDVEIPAGAIIGGFVTVQNNVFIGINATVRNRITIGEKAIVGMGSVVTKDVSANTTVVGNPARLFEKESK